MRFVAAAIVLACVPSIAEEKFSGKFDADGARLEHSPTGNFGGTLPGVSAQEFGTGKGEEVRKQRDKTCKSVAEWSIQAATARSGDFRENAARAISCIAKHSARDLTADEVEACRASGLKLATSTDPKVRYYAAVTLVHVADDTCRAAFHRLIKDQSHDTRLAAIDGLSMVGDDSSTGVLRAFVLNPVSDYGSDEAIRAIESIGTPAARKALEEISKQTKHPRAKERAAVSLDTLDEIAANPEKRPRRTPKDVKDDPKVPDVIPTEAASSRDQAAAMEWVKSHCIVDGWKAKDWEFQFTYRGASAEGKEWAVYRMRFFPDVVLGDHRFPLIDFYFHEGKLMHPSPDAPKDFPINVAGPQIRDFFKRSGDRLRGPR